MTPSHVAAEEGREEILALMLRSGGSADAANVNLNTPLHLAAEHGKLNCVRALLAAVCFFRYITPFRCLSSPLSAHLLRFYT